MSKRYTPKRSASTDYSVPNMAQPRQITRTNDIYTLSPQLREAALRAQFQPRMISISSNVITHREIGG